MNALSWHRRRFPVLMTAPQIDDLMARRDVRPPAGWEEPGASNNSGDNGSPKAPRPVDEPRTPNPGNTMSEQLGDK